MAETEKRLRPSTVVAAIADQQALRVVELARFGVSSESRRASASPGPATDSTRMLPPPWVCRSIAFGPMSASRSRVPVGKGSSPRGLLSNTNDREATWRNSTGSIGARGPTPT